jgi:hypothetical protein
VTAGRALGWADAALSIGRHLSTLFDSQP